MVVCRAHCFQWNCFQFIKCYINKGKQRNRSRFVFDLCSGLKSVFSVEMLLYVHICVFCENLCATKQEKWFCVYNSLVKSLCYQTEESNPILQTILFLCNSILYNHFSAIPFSAIISLQFHSLYQTHPKSNK